MTYNEWIELAEEWERRAEQADATGDITQAEYCWNKAKACRANALYGTEA